MNRIKLNLRTGMILFLLILLNLQGWSYSLSRFDQSWCAASFPTGYVSGSFIVSETSVTEFGKNQTNRTMIFSLPAGFQFNTTGGTYSVTGTSANDITAISISAITTTQITVRVSVSNTTQVDLNTITISCQIRASAANSTGIIYRNGGNLKLDKSTSKPRTTESLGNLSAFNVMSFTSCTTTHTNVTGVPQGINDIEILQIQVVINGTCTPFNLTDLTFNTDGGNGTGTNNPLSNITTAKVYYTGTTNNFSPSGLFGTSSSPNGSFTISGSQALMNGTNYFWLVYDVPGTAIAGNRLDASCSSLTIDGGVGARVPTTQNPTGSRVILAINQYYSIASGNWNNGSIWSSSDGGASCSCVPVNTGNVIINNGHTVIQNIADTVEYLTIRNGGRLTDNGSSLLRISSHMMLQGSGYLTRTSAVTIGGNLTTSGTGVSTTTSSFTVIGNATIGSGTSLTSNAAAGLNIIIQKDLNIYGTLSSGNNGATILLNSGTSQILTGNGTISGSGNLTISSSDKSIASGSVISINPNIVITGNITITNQGTIMAAGDVNGTNTNSTFTNEINGTLNIAGSLMNTGKVIATAIPNTINYYGAGAQSIYSTTYHILQLSTSGTKTFAGNTTINGELNISGSVVAVSSNRDITGAGNVTMTGTSEWQISKTGTTVPELSGTYSLTAGTITFNGTNASTQTLRGVTYFNVNLSGSNASSNFDLTSVSQIAGNLNVLVNSQMQNNGILDIDGNFTYSSSRTSTLANDIIVGGLTSVTSGNLALNTRYLTTEGVTLSSGATINATNSAIEIVDAGNWTNNGGTFTNTGSIVLFSGNSPQTIGGTASTTFNNLSLNNSFSTIPQITLGRNIQVRSTLSLVSGTIDLGGYTLTVGISAANIGAISYTSGWTYNGIFKRWYNTTAVADGSVGGLLPVGTSAVARLAYINAPSTAPTTGGSVSAMHTGSLGLSIVNFPDGAVQIERRYDSYWTFITGDGLAGGTWNITTSGAGINTLGSISPLRLTLAAGVVGTAGTNSGTAPNPTVPRTGLTLAQLTNNFYWGFPSTALPVELLRFTATADEKQTHLKWSTASEVNSSHFNLYRAGTDLQYELIGKIQSNGNTSFQSDYYYLDTEPNKGINYYKLTETDINGNEEYLSIATARINSKNRQIIVSNPVSSELLLQLDPSESINIRIYDSAGRLVYNEEHSVESGAGHLQINCSDFQQGIYLLVVNDGDTPFQGRFVKQ